MVVVVVADAAAGWDPCPPGVVEGADDPLAAMVVVARSEGWVVVLAGACKIPATAPFCCAEACGPAAQADAAQPSVRTSKGSTLGLLVRRCVGLSFRSSRDVHGRTHNRRKKEECRKHPEQVW
jgi:hypothetical protein